MATEIDAGFRINYKLNQGLELIVAIDLHQLGSI
jgi:hypothetical protein